jgi:hypothetical protein
MLTTFIIFFLHITIINSDILSQDYQITGRDVPQEFLDAFKFLEFIKYTKEPKGEFKPEAAPRWSRTIIDSIISDNGINFSDVNEDSSTLLSKNVILASLAQRKGMAFKTFSHISHIYSIPYKQYSELSFAKDTQARFIVNIANWYTLTFIREKGRLKLCEINYRQLEGN